MDTQGVEDPKLFVWPGKGVYAVFGRKPEALGASPYCKDPIFVQFVVQVRNAGWGGWGAVQCHAGFAVALLQWRCIILVQMQCACCISNGSM